MSDGPKPEKQSPAERLSRLQACAKQVFGDPAVALVALTHKSYCNEHKDEPCEDNERLEFLGDAVVDLAIGQRLMERFPRAAEGELSKLRALIVNEEGLARVARVVGVGDLLLLGRGEDLTGGREKNSVLADALEAVVGALYVGNGMAAVLTFIDAFFGEALDGVAEGRQGRDNKSLLQEASQQKLKSSPRYRVVSESGPEHEKIFEVEVSIGGEIYARSTGRSKKEAEQAAAEKTLELFAPKT
ncbi:MAG: ribonuclease III [Archangium sp.]|nr:ribonuclease III [Archangium sp.]MDP3157740.1 ribonuclease III [Archangium sp.]MDP3575259.1 ribonuclease III [Archangium sp.]